MSTGITVGATRFRVRGFVGDLLGTRAIGIPLEKLNPRAADSEPVRCRSQGLVPVVAGMPKPHVSVCATAIRDTESPSKADHCVLQDSDGDHGE